VEEVCPALEDHSGDDDCPPLITVLNIEAEVETDTVLNCDTGVETGVVLSEARGCVPETAETRDSVILAFRDGPVKYVEVEIFADVKVEIRCFGEDTLGYVHKHHFLFGNMEDEHICPGNSDVKLLFNNSTSSILTESHLEGGGHV